MARPKVQQRPQKVAPAFAPSSETPVPAPKFSDSEPSFELPDWLKSISNDITEGTGQLIQQGKAAGQKLKAGYQDIKKYLDTNS